MVPRENEAVFTPPGSSRLGNIGLRHSAGRPALHFVKGAQPFQQHIPLLACDGAALRKKRNYRGEEDNETIGASDYVHYIYIYFTDSCAFG